MSLKSVSKNKSTPIADCDDAEWAERSEHWNAHRVPTRGRAKKFRHREPLILCGHGVKIRVDHGTLLIHNGFTHYPQKREEYRFFPGDADLPSRIVMLDGSGGLSFDALDWMSDQKITLVKLDWRGRTQMFGGLTGYSAKPEIVAAQRAAQIGSKQIKIARWLTTEKIAASLETLNETVPISDNQKAAVERVEKWLKEIKRAPASISHSKLLGIEGAAAAAYFGGWQGIPLKWGNLKRKPIPDNWRNIAPRNMSWRKSGQNARHPLNAMLNYSYGILISQIRAEIVANGFDPSIGITHGTSQNRIPLVYDLMEPIRPLADRKVLAFACSHTFTPGDFTINQHGGCRLNPQMASSLIREIIFSKEIKPLIRKFGEYIGR